MDGDLMMRVLSGIISRVGGGTPPVIETTSTYNSGGGTVASFIINKPAGVVSGDLLIVFMTGTNGITNWAQASGWTMIDENIGSGVGKAAQWLIAGGSEPATYTFTQDAGTGGRVAAAMLRISGANATTPINDHTMAYFASSPASPQDCTGITTTVDNCLGLVGALEGLNTTTKPDVTFPTSGWAEQLDFSGGSYAALAVGLNSDLGTSGSEACQIAWTSGSMGNIGLFLMAIAPA